MRVIHVSAVDDQLIREAQQIAREHHRDCWNVVGAALRTKAGRTFTAIHLDAEVGRIAVCAEAIALGMVIAAGVNPAELETGVAVAPADGSLKEFSVLDPCGMCRELLTDYAPQLEVIIAMGSSLGKVAVSDLIPGKESRPRRRSRQAF